MMPPESRDQIRAVTRAVTATRARHRPLKNLNHGTAGSGLTVAWPGAAAAPGFHTASQVPTLKLRVGSLGGRGRARDGSGDVSEKADSPLRDKRQTLNGRLFTSGPRRPAAP